MTNFICVTCGTQFADSDQPPAACPICTDERQYVGHNGQQWITLADLQRDHHNIIKPVEPHLIGIGTHPAFAIAQRALLVQTPEGNLLWDCISLLDQPTIAAVNDLGGIKAIAISHPHYYSSMIEWAQTFNAPIFIHAADQTHVMRQHPAINYWQGETHELFGGLSLIRCGGHFAGGQVLHWPTGADGRGALLTGDIIQVIPDRHYVSFMYSYPNLIPLSASAVQRIAAAVMPYQYDRIYGAWWDRMIPSDAAAAVARSTVRYINALTSQG